MELSIYYQNVRGLRTKTNSIKLNSLSCDYNIICLTETFLNDSIYSQEVLCDKYNIVRRDRSTENSVKSDGGGVLIGIDKSVTYEVKSDWCSGAEDVWISVSVGNTAKKIKLHVCCVYLPPIIFSQSWICS